MKTQTEITQTLFNIHRDNIPRVYHSDFEKLDKLDPGMNGTAIKMVLDNLDVIKEGRILVVSGPIGCGKTFSAFVLALWRDWTEMIEQDFNYLKETAKGVHWNLEFDESEHESILKDSEEAAFQKAISKYSKWVKNRDRFRFDRAIEVIEMNYDIKSLRNFKNLAIIDDLGREYFTDKGYGISKWDGFFDVRYSDVLPTLITTNMTPDEFVEKYNVRIYDRLKQIVEWITIEEESLRGRK